ncbi:MAG TPA: hypothetical protein VMW54_10340 [Terriglobia bacterium]|nr:hypothetical protein [Terriglobia bacterium]
MKIVVTFAVDWELRPWRKLRFFRSDPSDGRIFRAHLGETEILAILTGVGPQNAVQALRSCLKESPDLCIASGLAGGLKSEHRSGDILAARTVCRETGTASLASNDSLFNQAVECGAKAAGRFVSVAKVVRTRKGKLQLGALADAVDMESYAVMEEMQICGVPSVAIRSVADEVELELMCDFDRALDNSGRVRMTQVLGQVARAPQEIWPLIKFGIVSSRAAARLARYLDAYISVLEESRARLNLCAQQIAK